MISLDLPTAEHYKIKLNNAGVPLQHVHMDDSIILLDKGIYYSVIFV